MPTLYYNIAHNRMGGSRLTHPVVRKTGADHQVEDKKWLKLSETLFNRQATLPKGATLELSKQEYDTIVNMCLAAAVMGRFLWQ